MNFLLPKLSDSKAGISGTSGSLRAGINPAPTKRVDLPVVGAGFTPARIGCWSLQVAHFEKRCQILNCEYYENWRFLFTIQDLTPALMHTSFHSKIHARPGRDGIG